MKAFQIAVTDDVLDDLHYRLTHTRFTSASDDTYWAAGVDPGYLRDLVAYWADGFDWRAAEKALNAYPHYLAEVSGRQVHFVHVRGKRTEGAPAPMPLILSHGWPSSFVEMLPVIGPLTDPAGHGGDPADAFDVIIPSLPGFLFSELPDGPYTRRGVGEAWHSLMTGTLGYQRFGGFGGDIGGGATQWLGALYPDNVTGIHLTTGLFTDDHGGQPLTAAEKAYLEHVRAYDERDQGYSEIMWSRPDTIAAALMDSPAGLAAWIIDKYRDWSDCAGAIETRWDFDTLLTIITLYWATGTIGSSFRQYYNYPMNEPVPKINVPSAMTLSNEPLFANLPKSFVERRLIDLRHWSTPARGGHFMAHEEPMQVAEELRIFFRPLRA
jgi:pimeloyl-ACP methyl ester carboxylesterase